MALSERSYLDDVIRHEYENFGYTRKPTTIHNRTGATITSPDVMCQPVRADSSVASEYRFLVAGEESYCTGLLIYNGSFAVTNLLNAGALKAAVLVRGPAIINKDALPAKDVSGGTLDHAALAAALAGLTPPILSNPEFPQTVTQTL
jgi:hypothetical protein